jgi:hypothetical protein
MDIAYKSFAKLVPLWSFHRATHHTLTRATSPHVSCFIFTCHEFAQSKQSSVVLAMFSRVIVVHEYT